MRRLLLFMMLCSPIVSPAQDQDAGAGPVGSDASYEIGFHLGELLPNQVKGVTEIMGLGSARLGFRLSPLAYFETGAIFGNGEGQEWRDVHGDFRIDVPVQNIVGIALVGADATYFSSISHSSRVIFGGHVGGGVQAHLMGSCWFRGDMKFSFSPGTTLYFGFGLVWRLGSGGTSGT